jgi:hypothetical protein
MRYTELACTKGTGTRCYRRMTINGIMTEPFSASSGRPTYCVPDNDG